MTLKTTIAGHVSSVFLNSNHFAETVLRYVGGIKGRMEQVTALLDWDSTNTAYERDRATRRVSSLMVISTQAVTVKDVFKVNGDIISVASVGPVQDGAIIVQLNQYVPQVKGGTPLRTGDL